jgi:hypothetical protein
MAGAGRAGRHRAAFVLLDAQPHAVRSACGEGARACARRSRPGAGSAASSRAGNANPNPAAYRSGNRGNADASAAPCSGRFDSRTSDRSAGFASYDAGSLDGCAGDGFPGACRCPRASAGSASARRRDFARNDRTGFGASSFSRREG